MNEKNIALIGYKGFVGSAIARKFKTRDIEFVGVDRSNFEKISEREFGIIINSAMPSKRFWAKNNPLDDFQSTVMLTAKLFYNWNYDKLVQISSVSARCQLNHVYGKNKKCAEELVLTEQNNLIIRLGAMYGAGLDKGALFDIINDKMVYVSEKSKYNFIDVDAAADLIIDNIEYSGIKEIGAKDEISLKEIAKKFNKKGSFSGEIEYQNTIDPEPNYPSSSEVLSYLENNI
tara:strand:- start:530 stop:1225 length:696 start_codon:yes stop_codon:yes gene_type:complete